MRNYRFDQGLAMELLEKALLAIGILIGRRLAISAEGRFGAGLRREYGEAFQLSPGALVAPRLELNLWVEVRL